MAYPTDADIAQARQALAAADPLLARAAAVLAPVAWRTRPPGFASLARLIVEQQVSTAAAAAIWGRLEVGLGGAVTPEAVLAASDERLRGFGLSGQKVRYVRAVAQARSMFAEIPALGDEDALARLTSIKGVGRWTAEVYLLFAEGRMDFFPAADVALQEGLRLLEDAPARLDAKALYRRAEAWRPWRGVAALMLWAWYSAARRAN